jgi:hypothetical protein
MGVFVCLLLLFSSRFNSPNRQSSARFAVLVSLAAVCLLAQFCVERAKAQIVINELYYDHPGIDAGHEFVELINMSDAPVNLAGVTVDFHNGTGDAWEVLWSGTAGTIPPGELFTIGGKYVSPSPQVVVELGLQNGPDAVRLAIAGVPVDVVGYGGLDDPEYTEGQGAPKVDSGRSLARLPDGRDTDNNADDFAEAVPSAGLFNVPRRDALITVSSPTQAAAVLPDDGYEQLFLALVNNGQYDIVANDIAVELWDSTEASRLFLKRLVHSETIPSGANTVVTATLKLTAGYHRLIALLHYAQDEREHNNELLLIRRVGGPSLLVSEVLCYPDLGCPQFVELFNAGDQDIDIVGFMLRDKSHPPTSITHNELVIPAGGYLAVTPDAEALLQKFSNTKSNNVVQHEGSWPTLNRSGSGAVSDSVVVSDYLALPVDAVAYPPVDSEYQGRSLERVDLYRSARTQTWVLSLDPSGASPGRANDRSLLTPPQTGAFDVAPRTFSPYDGEILTIAVDTGENATNAVGQKVVVSVYDMRGRRLAEVGSASAFPAVFVWNGTNVDGRVLPPGLYLVVCESYSSSGEPRSARKVVVGCGRRIP